MRIKSLISLVAVACLLTVTFSPLTARNTPYPDLPRDNAAHPWQDDDQYVGSQNYARINVPLGPIVISVDIPVDWLGGNSNNARVATSPTKKQVKTAKPMSLNQKGDIR